LRLPPRQPLAVARPNHRGKRSFNTASKDAGASR
jgi:hypothetical protein